MSDVIGQRYMKQWMTYWAPGPPSMEGRKTFENPVELKVRWEEEVQNVEGGSGNNPVIVTEIWSPIDLQTDGAAALGRIVDQPDQSNPYACGAYRIMARAKLPNRNARKYLRRYFVDKIKGR